MQRVAHQNAAFHWTFLVFYDRYLGFVVRGRADHHCYRLNNTANVIVTAMVLRLTIIVVAVAAAFEPMAISVNLFVSKHF